MLELHPKVVTAVCDISGAGLGKKLTRGSQRLAKVLATGIQHAELMAGRAFIQRAGLAIKRNGLLHVTFALVFIGGQPAKITLLGLTASGVALYLCLRKCQINSRTDHPK